MCVSDVDDVQALIKKCAHFIFNGILTLYIFSHYTSSANICHLTDFRHLHRNHSTYMLATLLTEVSVEIDASKIATPVKHSVL